MRIWSTKGFTEINRQNRDFLQDYIFEETKPATNFRVGIVGGGPKGIYALERLASVWQLHLPDEKLEIVCFNNDEHFASGPNYLPEQPDYLLINYSLGNVNFWTDDEEQLVENRTSLLEFMNLYQEKNGLKARPEDFCSRALTGIYLQHCLCQVIASLPDTISLQLVPSSVISLDVGSEELILTSEARKVYSFSEVILCTGHSYSFQDKLSKQLRESKANNSYFENIYPIGNLRKTNFSGENVLIQGMGLTFVDAVLGLTEGLGGRFDFSANSMIYIPSGLEPATIYPFSRSGLPMLARKAGGAENLSLKFFSNRFVEKLLALDKKLDFEADIYPIIEKEYRYQYVKNILGRFCDLIYTDDLGLEEMEYLAQKLMRGFVPFNLQKFFLPTHTAEFHHDETLNYIEQSISPDQFPLEVQATQEMSAVWRAIYPNFRKLYNFGGLTGKSQEQVDQVYFGKFQRVSYGPPAWNMKKMHALAKADILRFDIGPDPTLHIEKDSGKYKIKSEGMAKPIEAGILVNARIAKMGDINSQPQIYKHLHDKYGLRQFRNDAYSPGCFNLNEHGTLTKLKGVTLNGTPTEGWTLDNESLSRTNNNFITPWAKKIVTNYVSTTPQTNPYCPSLD